MSRRSVHYVLLSACLAGQFLLADAPEQKSGSAAPGSRSVAEALAALPGTNSHAVSTRKPAPPSPISTANLSINWRTNADSVDARILKQPLSRVLPHIAKATGWQVFVEPGADTLVSSAFRNQPSRTALDRILSDFNYAILPATNGRPRLVVFRTAASSATEEIDAADALRVDNELVVRLKDGAKLTPEELARLTGGELAGKIDPIHAARLRYADAAAAEAAREKLAALDGVTVDDNHRLPGNDSVGIVDGLAAGGGLSIRPAQVATGRLVIGLIDSVVQPINPAYDAFLVGRESVVASATTSTDLSHGTSMFANLIKAAEATAGPSGATPNFGVLAVDVYGGNESTTAFDVAMGIQRAIEKGANVINLSLSSEADSPFLHGLIQSYKGQGVLFLAAAGNDPVYSPTYPASYPEVLAVTAGNSGGQYAPYANRGPFVDLMLPGSGIVPYAGDQWLVTGTSTATAYASGIAGALWNPSIGSPANLDSVLRTQFGLKKP
jgi:hypothetical protein